MKIYERCTCGGSVEVDGSKTEVVDQIGIWRDRHKGHAMVTVPSPALALRPQPWYADSTR